MKSYSPLKPSPILLLLGCWWLRQLKLCRVEKRAFSAGVPENWSTPKRGVPTFRGRWTTGINIEEPCRVSNIPLLVDGFQH